MNWFLNLDIEDQEFIKQLILSSGSLKKLAKIYEVSYPTIRLRLDNVIQKIQFIENNKVGGFENKIMKLVIDEKISLDLAKEIIKDFKEDKNE